MRFQLVQQFFVWQARSRTLRQNISDPPAKSGRDRLTNLRCRANSDQQPALVAMVDPPAIVARFDDVAMVCQSVQERGCHFGIGEHARPFGEGKVGCQQDG